MAAGSGPIGSIPVKQPSNDVKTEPEESSAPVGEETKDPIETDADLEEKDLEQFSDLKKIPYSRFKEVNDKAKTLQEQLKAMERRSQEDLRRAIEDAELRAEMRLKQRYEEAQAQEGIDPYERRNRELSRELESLKHEIKTVRGLTAEQRLQSDLEKLEKRYPEADTLAVLGWAKNNPNADLSELMETSHTRNVERVDRKLREVIESKKAKAKTAIPTRDSGTRLLKETEKPKSIKEAHQALKKFLGI